VTEGNGIAPDTLVNPNKVSRYVERLGSEGVFFSFATILYHTKEFDDIETAVDDELLERFKEYAVNKKFTYQEASEEMLEALREVAEAENYSPQFFDELADIEDYIQEDKQHAFSRHSEEIGRTLISELMLRYYGEKRRIEYQLHYDNQFLLAIDLLRNEPLYNHQLQLTTAD